MLLFYIFHRWDMKNAFMEPERKEPLFIENLELLGFQRLSDDEQNRLYLLKRDAFKTALEPDAQELQRMSLQQLWQLFPIVIRPYSARYKDWYDTQCQCLQTLLKDQIVRISHIGSTAVPGLEAKPCVDILLETDTRYPQALIQTLMENGWGLCPGEGMLRGRFSAFIRDILFWALQNRYSICMCAILMTGMSSISAIICLRMRMHAANMQI